MPTPPLSDEKALEALQAWERHGRSRIKAAQELDIPVTTLENRMNTAKRRGLNVDPAIRDSMNAVGTGMVPTLAWAKTKSEDGTSYSVLLKPEQGAEDATQRIRDALEGMEPAKAVPAPKYADEDLCTVYPIADRHNGMKAWGRETGEDYDSQIASSRLTEWMGRCIESSPASGLAVILDNGDGEHADDFTNATPKSKHTLDVDTRLFMTLETSVASLAAAVELALEKHSHVVVRILPGNHNPTTYMAVMFALAERYRNEPRVEVQKEPGEFWVQQFGNCMLAAHHGDKAKPQQMVMFLADEYAPIWGVTRHRFLWTGHLHHMKADDIGGVQWEQLRAMTARDAYATSHAYVARAQLQAITLHRERGEIQRVKVGV